MNAVWACVKCDGPQEVEMIEVTSLMDGPYNRRYIDGMHEACPRCGSTARPIRWQRCPAIGPMVDQPRVPTPEDLLRAAGIPMVATLRMDLLEDEWGFWDEFD